jgi:prepilin-type N-terminal cleavage/methylation domain-containing protein
MKKSQRVGFQYEKGFSLIELIFVIAIISLISSVVLASLGTAKERARYTKAKVDISQISKLITVAKGESRRTGISITGTSNSGFSCEGIGSIQALPLSHGCWTAYTAAISSLNTAANNIYKLNSPPVDPWGAPYLIDENEGFNGLCYTDHVASAGPDGVPYSSDDVLYNITDTNCEPNIGGRFANNLWN